VTAVKDGDESASARPVYEGGFKPVDIVAGALQIDARPPWQRALARAPAAEG
jgi:hypothetical protein